MFTRLFLPFIAIATPLLLNACGTTGRPFKAKPASLSPFIEDQTHVRHTSEEPFQAVWNDATPQQQAAANEKRNLCILPVEVRYLRPIGKRLARNEHKSRPIEEISRTINEAFAGAFQKSETPHFRIVPRPGPDTLTLQIALSELDPTSVRGNVLKKAASVALTPIAGLAGRFTRGSIAIEGKLRDPAGDSLVFQFADREQDKMTFWSLRDFRPYGHSRVAITEWARQFEKLTRTPDWEQTLRDSSFFTLSPL